MTRPQDVVTDKWYTVTKVIGKAGYVKPPTPEDPVPRHGLMDAEYEGIYSGYPVQVKAVSLPFVLVKELLHERHDTLDTRLVKFAVADPKYVSAMKNLVDYEGILISKRQFKAIVESDQQGTRQWKNPEYDDGKCQRCGSDLCERRTGIGIWEPYCKVCREVRDSSQFHSPVPRTLFSAVQEMFRDDDDDDDDEERTKTLD